MPLPPEFDEYEDVDWTVAFTTSGLTRHQQQLAAKRLTDGLAQAARAEARVTALEQEVARLRTMIAALVDHLADRGGVDMQVLDTRIADALAKAAGQPPPAGAGPYR